MLTRAWPAGKVWPRAFNMNWANASILRGLPPTQTNCKGGNGDWYYITAWNKNDIALQYIEEKIDRHFAGDIFKCISLKENACVFIQVSLKYLLNGSIHSNSSLVQVMTWHLIGEKALPEPMLTKRTYGITKQQWVNSRHFDQQKQPDLGQASKIHAQERRESVHYPTQQHFGWKTDIQITAGIPRHGRI